MPGVHGMIEELLLAIATNTLAEQRGAVQAAFTATAGELANLLGEALEPEVRDFLKASNLWPTLVDRIDEELQL